MVIGSVGLADLSRRVEKLNVVSDEVTRDELLDARVPNENCRQGISSSPRSCGGSKEFVRATNVTWMELLARHDVQRHQPDDWKH